MGLELMVFIGSVLIYFFANYYIYRHISVLCQSPLGKVVLIVLVLAMIAYPCGRLLQAFTSLKVSLKYSPWPVLTILLSWLMHFIEPLHRLYRLVSLSSLLCRFWMLL